MGQYLVIVPYPNHLPLTPSLKKPVSAYCPDVSKVIFDKTDKAIYHQGKFTHKEFFYD